MSSILQWAEGAWNGQPAGAFPTPPPRPKTTGKPAPSGGAPPVPTPGAITIARDDGQGSVTELVGDGTPKVSAGGGGWQSVQRDGRVALQWWNGREPAAVTLPIVLVDDPSSGASVDARAMTLEKMFGVGLGDGEAPPTVRFNAGGLVPLDATDPRAASWQWSLSACDESDGVQRDTAGHRIFTTYTITLLRIVATTLLTSEAEKRRAARAKTAGGKTKAKHKKHLVQAGESLASITSLEYYGDLTRMKDVAKANGIRDWRKQLTPGQTLKLP